MKSVLQSMRPPFLILTPACIFLGMSTSVASGQQVQWTYGLLALMGALAAHISVNTFNEYFDFRSGLDIRTEKTPFSGGSGALVDNPAALNSVLLAAIISLVITLAVGFFFVSRLGLGLLPIGILGVVIILSYTQLINRQPLICLLAPGIAFGPLMVVGTHYVFTGEHSAHALFVSLVPGFLVSNLLLLNQFPDVDADMSVGRKNLPITLGLRRSTYIYGLLLFCAACIIVLGILTQRLPKLSAMALLSLLPAVVAFFGTLRNAGTTRKLIPFMALNVVTVIVTPVLLGLSLILG